VIGTLENKVGCCSDEPLQCYEDSSSVDDPVMARIHDLARRDSSVDNYSEQGKSCKDILVKGG